MIFQRINFHDNKLPVFKENKAKGFVTFGADNLYPDFLVELFNKSPKHNAIVSAKASYIAGIGTDVFGQNTTDIAKAEAKLKNINAYETYEEQVCLTFLQIIEYYLTYLPLLLLWCDLSLVSVVYLSYVHYYAGHLIQRRIL